MKRFITLATVLLVGLASVQAAQTDDQQKKKKKKQAQTTTQATPAPKKGGTQASDRRVSTQTTKPHVSSQTTNSQTSKKTSSGPKNPNRTMLSPTTMRNGTKRRGNITNAPEMNGRLVRRNAGIGGNITTAIGGGATIIASSVTVAVIGIGIAAGGIPPTGMIPITATMFTMARSSGTATLRPAT